MNADQSDELTNIGNSLISNTSRNNPTLDASPIMSRVLRGSILIRNAVDTSGTPRLISFVESGDDPADLFVVEQNSNLFHGSYFQTRQNPLYNSDPDLTANDVEEDENEDENDKENNNHG